VNFIRQIFQDVDGDFSSKRTAFFVFIVLFVFIASAMFFHVLPKDTVPLMQSTQEKITDLIKWIGGFIVAEQGAKFAPKDK